MSFLDTNVVVDLLNDRVPLVRVRLAEALRGGQRPWLSSVVLAELRYCVAHSRQVDRNGRALDALIDGALEIVTFDADDADEAGTLRADLRRNGVEIGPYDLLIAAHARHRDKTLVTSDTRKFERVPRLMLADWSR